MDPTRLAAIENLGKVMRKHGKKPRPNLTSEVLKDIIAAAQEENADAIRGLAAKALGEGNNPGGPSKIDMDGYLEDVKAANEDKHLKSRLSAISRGEWPDNAAALQDLEYWQQFSDKLHLTSINSEKVAPISMDETHLQECKDCLSSNGWFKAQPTGWTVEHQHVVDTIVNLVAAGWPAVFIYMFDEPWMLLEQAWDVYAGVLDAEVILEPTVYTWYLKPELQARKSTSQNFGMPHRDYRYTESCWEDGTAKLLTVWMPMTKAHTVNGCLYVLPKEYDRHYDKDGAYEHMRGATKAETDPFKLELRFPAQGAKPLECQPGDCLGWMGNLIHWGSRCSPHAPHVRANLGCTFRRSDAEDFECGLGPISRERLRKGLSIQERLMHISRSLLLYSCHFELPKSTVPAQFWAAYGEH